MLSVLVSAFPALVSVVGMHFMYVLTKDRSLRKPVGLLGSCLLCTCRMQVVSGGRRYVDADMKRPGMAKRNQVET